MKQFGGTRQRVGYGAIFVGTLLSLLGLFGSSPFASAATGVNQQLSYQARLLDNSGAAVADGTYNMEFKIYQDGDGALGGGDETLKWTETRTGGNKVTVKNGYFSVMLGAVTAFNASVDWNQDTLWLSTNIGGTGTPTWDGEMSPFRRLAAAPYALNANRVGGLTASQLLQLAPSAVQTDSGTASSIFLNKTGASGNILQLQKNGVDVLSISNSGLAIFSNGVSVGSETVTDLSGNGLVVSGNSLAVRLDTTAADGSSTSSVSGLEFVSGELSLLRGCGANEILKWDNINFEWDCATDQASGGSADLDGVYDNDTDKVLGIDSATGLLFNMTTTGDFAVQDNGVSVLTVNDNGTILFKPSADNTAAFEVQKSGSSTQLFIIDSSNDRVYIGDDTADGTGAVLVVDTKNTPGDPSPSVDGAMYYNSDSKNFRCRHNGLWQDCDFASFRSEWVLQEDFANTSVTSLSIGQQGWLFASIGTGGTIAKVNVGTDASDRDRYGVLQLNSPATANTGAHLRLDPTSMSGVPSNLVVEFDFAPVNAAAAAGLQQITRIGLHDSTGTGAPTDGLYFLYTATTTAGNWQRCTQTTCVDTGVARTTTANQYQRFRIQTNSAGTAVEFFINETSVGTASTNLPGASASYGPAINTSTVDATIRQWKIDFFQIKRNLTTLR